MLEVALYIIVLLVSRDGGIRKRHSPHRYQWTFLEPLIIQIFLELQSLVFGTALSNESHLLRGGIRISGPSNGTRNVGLQKRKQKCSLASKGAWLRDIVCSPFLSKRVFPTRGSRAACCPLMCLMWSVYIFVILCHSFDKKLLLDITKHASLMASVFDSTFCCDQLYSLMKDVKSRTIGGMHADRNNRN